MINIQINSSILNNVLTSAGSQALWIKLASQSSYNMSCRGWSYPCTPGRWWVSVCSPPPELRPIHQPSGSDLFPAQPSSCLSEMWPDFYNIDHYSEGIWEIVGVINDYHLSLFLDTFPIKWRLLLHHTIYGVLTSCSDGAALLWRWHTRIAARKPLTRHGHTKCQKRLRGLSVDDPPTGHKTTTNSNLGMRDISWHLLQITTCNIFSK